jgi:hypothetical protein
MYLNKINKNRMNQIKLKYKINQNMKAFKVKIVELQEN